MKFIGYLYHSWVRYVAVFIMFPMLITAYIVYKSDLEIHARKNYGGVKVIPSAWVADGNKSVSSYAVTIFPSNFNKQNALIITYDLHGLCLLGGQAASISFERTKTNESHQISLANYGKNCYEGEQTVSIPLTDFGPAEKIFTSTKFKLSFWYQSPYKIDVKNVLLSKISIKPQPKLVKKTTSIKKQIMPQTKESTQSGTVASIRTVKNTNFPWDIRSVSSMKETKDKICGQDDDRFIDNWASKAAELGINYISIETPYDSPECGDSIKYTEKWINAVRKNNLSVWHRHMPLAFEGIYDVTKSPENDYLGVIENYIKNHPDFFKKDDIFTPIPEPQNGGIKGITYCPNSICQFQDAEQFNAWLRDSILISRKAFEEIGLKDAIKIGFFGFDGFVAWGDNNPDWEGILEDKTVELMGNITIDHYPEIVDGTMSEDLDELQKKYPDIPIVIGEWGTISGDNNIEQIKTSMGAAKRKGVIGFNYWHMGIGGNESLLNTDLSEKNSFQAVKDMFYNQ